MSRFFPKTATEWTQRGDSLFKTNDISGAKQAYEKAISLNPKHISAWFSLGLLQLNQKESDKAETTFQHIITLEPKNVGAMINLGVARDRQGKVDSAIEAYKDAISIDEERIIAWENLAESYKELKKIDESINAFEKVIELDPKNVNALKNLGEIFKEKGDLEKSNGYFIQALSIDSTLLETWFSFAENKKKLKDFNGAIESEQKALSISLERKDYENITLAYYNLACYQVLAGNLTAALGSLQEAMAADPEWVTNLAKKDADFNSIRSDPRFRNIILTNEEREAEKKQESEEKYQSFLGTFYVSLITFERELRTFIKERLGKGWEKRIKNDLEETYENWNLKREKDREWGIDPEEDIMNYSDLGDYIQIMGKFVREFSENREKLLEVVTKLKDWYNYGRNPIMHGRTITDERFHATNIAIKFLRAWMSKMRQDLLAQHTIKEEKNIGNESGKENEDKIGEKKDEGEVNKERLKDEENERDIDKINDQENEVVKTDVEPTPSLSENERIALMAAKDAWDLYSPAYGSVRVTGFLRDKLAHALPQIVESELIEIFYSLVKKGFLMIKSASTLMDGEFEVYVLNLEKYSEAIQK